MRSRIITITEIAVLLLIVFAGFGQAVLHLWNWLMPDLFGLRPITFWQAVGLMGLSWILFRAGFLGGRPYRTHGQRMRGRWDQMTPEQREKLRKGLQCGRSGAPPSEPEAG
jgi:hypothetical protein